VILRSRGGAVEIRAASAALFAPPPVERWSSASAGDETSLPVVLAAGRLISESIAGMGLCVYEDTQDEYRIPSESWQGALLEAPNDQMSQFQVLSHWVWGLLFHGGALSLKAKARGEVMELWPLDHGCWTARTTRDGLVFDIRSNGGVVTVDRSQALYIPGRTTHDALVGKSLIEIAAATLKKHLHAEVYQRRFYENDATPGGLVTTEQPLSQQQRQELTEAWSSRHQGPGNAGRIAVLGRGASFQSIGIAPRDAQLVEMAKFTVQEIARIFNVPVSLLGDPDAPAGIDMEQEMRRFLQVSLSPWMNAITQALELDRDLFPAGSPLEVEFESDEFVKADLAARSAFYTSARQAGWLSNNDIRRMEDLPAIEGGDEYQATPVGGSPNLQPGASGEYNAYTLSEKRRASRR
jgi:HK97 family phage portal protein